MDEHDKSKMRELSTKLDELYDAVVGNTDEDVIGIRNIVREILVIVKGNPEQPGLIKRVHDLEKSKEESDREKANERGFLSGAKVVVYTVCGAIGFLGSLIAEWFKTLSHKP